MKRYQVFNNIFGWVAFLIAAITYLLTIEPTASFWDCPEFISTAYKLDVGHPPGSPFFMIMGRFFTLFASDPTMVARMVNSMTALLSAFTILFLFWSITHIARRVTIKNDEELSTFKIIGILAAGMAGALAYTFSDTFWYSAVEGEVYGFSSFFTAIVFWLILKWESKCDQPQSDKWLILMAYMMGLSTGVHILNLLAIPSIVLIYYFRKFTPSTKGFILALIAGFGILGTVLYGVIPGFVQVACWFELFFVNTLGMAYNTGMYVYIVLAISVIGWALYESGTEKSYQRMIISVVSVIVITGIPFFGSHVIIGILLIAASCFWLYYKKIHLPARWINTGLLMLTVLLIGYSSYSVIVIRSSANPTMDQNSPNNIFGLKYYFNREQYGDHPLLYGPVYNAPYQLKAEGNGWNVDMETGDSMYSKKPKSSPTEKDEYIVASHKITPKMNSNFYMLFPRMYSTDPKHIEVYKSWANIQGKPVDYDWAGQTRTENKPTFIENLRFFVSYQVNFMYWRYFLWNFSGRQNDLLSYGQSDSGNWITGINFIDNLLIGDQTNLPAELKNNKARNTYYMLPLLLGIVGLIFLFYEGKSGRHYFWVVALLFFMTGLAIVIYLNQSPNQPRERDYAYAGSFYAFSIWIGLGVVAIIQFARKWINEKSATLIGALACMGVPALMACQNWDDHDRSNRYTCRDFGYNYLASCKKNAIIFTMGDNDTFPLWYNQEVEGQRTDVRVCNLSYLQTDWYINQMKRASYQSAPLPISWPEKDYTGSKNEVLMVDSLMPKLDMKTAMDFVKNDDPSTKYKGEAFVPTKHLTLPVDANALIQSRVIAANRKNEILPEITVDITDNQISRSDLMILEMIKENNWKRPVYFSITIGGKYLGLMDHFEKTGLAYQLLPLGTKGGDVQINTDEMYDNLMHKFRYGGINNPRVYLDENIRNMCRSHRMAFAQLIGALLKNNDKAKAQTALSYCLKMIPATATPHDYFSVSLAKYSYQLGYKQQGDQLMKDIASNCIGNINWCLSLNAAQQKSVNDRLGENLTTFSELLQVSQECNRSDIFNSYLPVFMDYRKKLGI